MFSPANLPEDIVRLIMSHEIYPECLKAYYSDSKKEWHKMLPYLSICHRWRAILAPVAYSHVFIRMNDFHSGAQLSDLECLKRATVYSNVCLVEHNGLAAAAKNLYIYVGKDSENPALLLNLWDGLCLGKDECPNLSEFCNSHQPTSTLEQDNPHNSNGKDAAAEVALALVHRFPNIRYLHVDSGRCPQSISWILSGLACHYLKQLTRFDYCFGLSGPNAYGLPNIVELGITPANAINSAAISTLFECNLDSPCLYFNPQAIRHLSIDISDSGFGWHMFPTNCNSKTIVFETLEKLSLSSFDDGVNLIDLFICDGIDVHFPYLKVLEVGGVVLTPDAIDYLARYPIKRLYCDDRALCGLHIENTFINKLDSLELGFSANGREEYAEYIHDTNTMFQKTKNIKHVSFYTSVNADFDFVGISWPYLTRLYFSPAAVVVGLLNVLQEIPNLVYLSIHCAKSDRNCLLHEAALLESYSQSQLTTRPTGIQEFKLTSNGSLSAALCSMAIPRFLERMPKLAAFIYIK